MNRNKKIKLLTSILLFIITLAPWAAFAQIGGGGGGDGTGNPDIPIDGGLGLLVAAGVAYGAKKVHEARKKKTGAGI